MSVFITIYGAKLSTKPRGKVAVRIISRDTVLTTNFISPSKNPEWNASLICTIKQKRLIFQILEEIQPLRGKITTESTLNFTSFQFNPEQNQKQTLKLKTRESGDRQNQLSLNVFFTQKKNYLCHMEFYELQDKATRNSQIQIVDNDPQWGDDDAGNRDKVIFYKGPCKSTNFFSFCDQAARDQQFQVIEEIYREHPR